MGSGSGLRLSESEYRVLEALKGRVEVGRWYSVGELAGLSGFSRSSLEAILRLLAEKGVVEVSSRERTVFRLTSEAERFLREGFPEERLVRVLAEAGGRLSVEELRERLGADFGVAMSNAARKGWVRVEGGEAVLVVDPASAVAAERASLERIARGESVGGDELRLLKRRRLVEVSRVRETLVRFLVDPGEAVKSALVEVGALTRELISGGKWRRLVFRRYNVAAEPPRARLGRLNFFVEFIEYIRDVMREMGFREVEAAPVETEFWNYDALFQPQFHPARQPSDTFYLKRPSKGRLPEELAVRVEEAHRAWGYKWDPSIAARLILRSHTTAVSARVLASKPRPPFRFFTIGRVYRVEKIDARHLPEFHQVDGIAAEDGVDLRWLLGFLGEFLERLGFREYKFRPAYFPFTEPSVEGYVRVSGKWLEVLGAGLFRPEMLSALGIDYPVAAWGMGIERLAMALYGLSDIRELYSRDVGFLSSIPLRWWLYAGSQV